MFEYKTAGAAMLDAQLEALEFFVGVANGRIACVVAEHPDLDTVEPIADVLRWRIGGFVAGQVQWGPWVGGPNAGRRMGLFIEKFYSDASFLETKITAYLAKSGSESFK